MRFNKTYKQLFFATSDCVFTFQVFLQCLYGAVLFEILMVIVDAHYCQL